jgi:FixJ family two-component response regulator
MLLRGGNIVLVVDDDAGILEGLQRLLWLHAYEPILFSSAEAFKKHTDFEKAVCIILDVNLNDGSGVELMHGLRAAGNFVPVILITGNDDPAVHKAALDSGCIALLTKPFSAQKLTELLNRARYPTAEL